MQDYFNIPKIRQREIAKAAHRERKLLSSWQRRQVRLWRAQLKGGKELQEQQRFFMKDIESLLITKNLIENDA